MCVHDNTQMTETLPAQTGLTVVNFTRTNGESMIIVRTSKGSFYISPDSDPDNAGSFGTNSVTVDVARSAHLDSANEVLFSQVL